MSNIEKTENNLSLGSEEYADRSYWRKNAAAVPSTRSVMAISGVQIREDRSGRYCLNDLHRAAVADGENKRTKEPSKFLAAGHAAELVGELTTQNPGSFPVRTVEGRNGGTYACKEIVYAYAMWVSARFHLHVIRTFDAVVTGQFEAMSARQSRERARLEAPALTDAVQYSRAAAGKDVKPYHFSNEFDLINRVVLGCSSKQYRAAHGLSPTDPIRDTLAPCQIKAIEHMQRLNASLIDVGMDFEQRKAKLHQVFLLRHQRELIAETLRLEA